LLATRHNALEAERIATILKASDFNGGKVVYQQMLSKNPR
jgi:hypothetical protein